MSARTSVRVDAKQPDGSSSLCDVSAGEGAPLNATSPLRSLEIETLCSRWRAAAHNLPPIEELALDGLGGLADSVALLQIDDAGELNILRAGKFLKPGSIVRRISSRSPGFRSTGRVRCGNFMPKP
jgi:hypothetical protein